MLTQDTQETPGDEERGGRPMDLPEDLQQELVNWLHRLEGHVRGVAGMIERGESGDEILVQLTAAKASISRLTLRVLEAYLDDSARNVDGAGEGVIERLKQSLGVVLKYS